MNPQYPEPTPQQNTEPQPQVPSSTADTPQSFTSTQQPAPVQYQPQPQQYEVDPFLATANQTATPQPIESNIFVSTPVVKKKKPVGLILIIVGVLLVAAIAAGGYFAWKSGIFGDVTGMTNQNETTPAAEAATFDTPESIETEITDIQSALDTVDDSQLGDETITDKTLNE